MKVSLLDKLIEPMKDYISFRDFVFSLSSINNEPLYEVVTYLLHHNLNSVAFYNIDTDYRIIRFEYYDFETVSEFLKEIQTTLSFSHEEWVWSHPTSINELRDQDRRALTNTISKAMHCFFKKSELLSFEPLNGLLHFDTTDKNTSKINVPTTRTMLGEYQKLLITYSFFTPRHLACLIADYNPAYYHNDDFYNARLDMVNNAIEAKLLTLINDKKQIAAEEAQLWLIKCGLIYKGFNSDLRYDTLETYQAEHSNQQIVVAETSKEINQELTAANAKIKALESELKKANAALAAAPVDDNTLQTILDESQDEHAPDLKHAIQLWIDLYIHGGIKGDSHSSKANIWIKNNTNYAENANSSIGRIREIATPLKDFGAKRSREEEK